MIRFNWFKLYALYDLHTCHLRLATCIFWFFDEQALLDCCKCVRPRRSKSSIYVWSIAAVQRRYLNTLSADDYFLLSIFEGGILYFVWVQWNWEVCWTSITQACVFSLAQCCVRLFVGWHLSVTWAETDLPKRHTAHFIPDDPTVAPQLELRWTSALLLFLLIYLVYLGV